MIIDNSAAKLWFTCPLAYKQRYIDNLELIERSREGLDFGTRFHDLQAERFRATPDGSIHSPLLDARLEAECQATFQAYLQHYGPESNLEVVDVERTLTVPLNERHTLAFKIDLLYRDLGGLKLRDYKTERRGGGYNSAEHWAAASQVSLYQFAAAEYYREPISELVLDITTRGSPKGQESPTFRRDSLIRTRAQQAAAVQNIIWIADQIESMQASGFYPSNTSSCKDGWKKCDYYQLCHIGRTDGNLKLYRPAEAYLDL